MSGGFAHDIAGGQGNLIITSVKSPNFVHLLSGWAISKDGSAEFNNLLAHGNITAGSISGTPIGSSTITGSDYQGGTMEETTITFDTGGGILYIYATTTSSTTFSSGSGNWTAPAGVTSVKAECWGGGGAGCNGVNSTGGDGGGAGEYAAELTLAVTAGNNYPYSVGAGGTNPSVGTVGDGGTTTFAGDSVTVTAHGGDGGTLSGGDAGGSGSTNSVHFNGGNSGGSVGGGFDGGGGGGGSGGTSATGHNGSSATTSTGANGGTAVAGGGAGGKGGNNANNGSAGSAPGGGGGGAGSGTPQKLGGSGAAGQVKLTWVTSQTLIGVISPSSGTVGGIAYPQGIAGIQAGTDYVTLVPSGGNAAVLFGASGAAGDVSLKRGGAGILNSDSSIVLATGKNISMDTWHTLGSYGNGWTTSRGRYRFTSEGELEIDINLTGTGTAGTFTWPTTLPAAYRPAVTKRIPGVPSSGSACHVTVNTSGAVSSTIPTGAGTFDCPGRVALD